MNYYQPRQDGQVWPVGYMSGQHCTTCTCAPEVSRTEYCEGAIMRGHEGFGCLEWRGHQGPHKAGVYGDPCPGCGALDIHAENCPTPDVMESGPLVDLTWTDADEGAFYDDDRNNRVILGAGPSLFDGPDRLAAAMQRMERRPAPVATGGSTDE